MNETTLFFIAMRPFLSAYFIKKLVDTWIPGFPAQTA